MAFSQMNKLVETFARPSYQRKPSTYSTKFQLKNQQGLTKPIKLNKQTNHTLKSPISETGFKLQGKKPEIKTGVFTIEKEKGKQAYRGGTGVEG